VICPLLSLGHLDPRQCVGEECAWWDAWIGIDENGVDREGCCVLMYLAKLEETVEYEQE